MPLQLRLEPWAEGDLPLLRRLLGDPAMMEHLGGPETEEQLVSRQARYERIEADGTGHIYQVLDETGEPLGSVGSWDKEWRGETVYETGWFVLPEHQGRGIASEATALVIDRARAEGKHRFLHAFPAVDNPPSNGICRKLGFELVEACDFEYRDQVLRCNDWQLDLRA